MIQDTALDTIEDE